MELIDDIIEFVIDEFNELNSDAIRKLNEMLIQLDYEAYKKGFRDANKIAQKLLK